MDKCVELMQVGEICLCGMWEGPYYREPPTAMVKAGPKGLRPEFGLS